MAITGAALVALRHYISSSDIKYFVLTNILIGITGLIKPSITILTIPAMLIFLLLYRGKLIQWLICIISFGIAIGLYLLPVFFQDIYPEAGNWILGIRLDSFKAIVIIFIRYTVWIGATWIFIGRQFKRLNNAVLQRDPLTWEDFLLIVIGGGFLFSLMFVEVGREFHGNNKWGLSASLILASPIVIVSLVEWVHPSQLYSVFSKIKKLAVLALLGLHLLSGTIFALSYPFYSSERYTNSTVSILKKFQSATPSQTRFLFDPSFPSRMRLMTYLARPALWRYASTPHSKKLYKAWDSTVKGNEDPWPIIRRYDALVIGPKTRWIIPLLEEKNWRFVQTFSHEFELWQAPDQNFLQQ
jgi:hypothetical protein